MIYFTSDTHFNQPRTLEFSKRPFSSVQQMNEVIIRNWNDRITNNDIVYHLGDFGDITFADKLLGKIILLVGNYELKDYTVAQLEQYFDVLHGPTTIKIDENEFHLMHEPTNRDRTKFNLFGHIHKLQMVKRSSLNVGVDCHNFTPLSLDEVLWYKKAIENHYDEEVFCI